MLQGKHNKFNTVYDKKRIVIMIQTCHAAEESVSV